MKEAFSNLEVPQELLPFSKKIRTYLLNELGSSKLKGSHLEEAKSNLDVILKEIDTAWANPMKIKGINPPIHENLAGIEQSALTRFLPALQFKTLSCKLAVKVIICTTFFKEYIQKEKDTDLPTCHDIEIGAYFHPLSPQNLVNFHFTQIEKPVILTQVIVYGLCGTIRILSKDPEMGFRMLELRNGLESMIKGLSEKSQLTPSSSFMMKSRL